MYNNYKHVHVHVVCAQCTAPFVPLRVHSISLRVLSPLLSLRLPSALGSEEQPSLMWASRQVFRLMLSCWGTVATVGREGGLIRLNHLSMYTRSFVQSES